jgi:hypothetical protein
MRHYSASDEENLRMAALLQEWCKSGFLDTSQTTDLRSELHTDTRRTNAFLRAVLFLFTVIIVVASVYLGFVTFHLEEKPETGALCIVAAAICFGLAELLVQTFRLYRYGVEEALASSSAILLGIGTALASPVESDNVRIFIALAVIAIVATFLYARFGFVYAAVAAILCAASTPFTFSWSGESEHLFAASICILCLLFVRARRRQYDENYPGDDYGVMQAFAWCGVYFVLNIHLPLFYGYSGGAFYWFSYAATWILPIVGLWLALPAKDRLFMQVNVGLLLVSLITNKPYLKLMRKPWDPILFGVLLIGVAIVIKRWLASGRNGQRYGYTPERILAGDRRLLNVVATMSSAVRPGIPSPPQPELKADFGGGRSGGAGATGNF